MKASKNQHWVLWYLSAGFALMILLSWVAAWADLPHLLFGGTPEAIDWRVAALHTGFILVIWAVSFLLVRRVVAHQVYLEEFLRVCAWCRKVGYRDKWLPLEQYFAQGFGMGTTHGICPECLKKAEEDTTQFFRRKAMEAGADKKAAEPSSPDPG